MTSSKKRKRDESAPLSGDISLIHARSSDFPPIVTSTVGVSLPQLPFKPYARPTLEPGKKKRTRSELLLHGENARLEYEGQEIAEDSQYHRYYVGIFDPATNTVEMHIAPKLHVTSAIKAHRQRDLEVHQKGTKFTYDESRVALGKAFGTKKAQDLLTSREINKVDVAGMDKSVSSAIVSQVEENTKDMPSTEELGRSMQSERPLPKYNAAATNAHEVYRREDLISGEEWDSIWVSDWVKNGVVNTKSSHINKRAMVFLQDSAQKHTRMLKILKYIGSLIDFFKFQQRTRGKLPPVGQGKKLHIGISPTIIEGFYAKFSETTTKQVVKDEEGNVKDSGERHTVSPKLEQKILYYIAILCLMVDGYDVDMFDLKHDLGIPPRELAQAFKGVGCSVRETSKTQYQAMGMTKQDAVQHKRAVLKIPLEFPPPPRKRQAATRKR